VKGKRRGCRICESLISLVGCFEVVLVVLGVVLTMYRQQRDNEARIKMKKVHSNKKASRRSGRGDD
jgi:hypothetical protein